MQHFYSVSRRLHPAVWQMIILTLISFPGLADNPGDTARKDKTLLFASDPYCPYICDQSAQRPGFFVEFAREALSASGFSVEYELKPWKRVLAEARAGIIDGVMTLSREDDEGLLLPDKPVLTTCQSVVTAKDTPYQWAGGESLAGWSMALVAGYTYDGPVREWLLANQDSELIHHIHGADAFHEILDLIARGKLDMTISDCNVAASTAIDIGYPDRFRYAATGYRVEMYIGMNPDHPDASMIIQTLDEALISMKQDGRLLALAKKYGIQNIR